MHKLSLALTLLASVTSSLAAAAASSAEVHKYDGEVNKGSYIVKVRDGAQKSGVMNRIGSFLGGNARVTHDWDSKFFNGFAGLSFHPCTCVVLVLNHVVVGNFGDNIIEVLKSSIDVEYIAEDGIMTTFDVQYVQLWSSVTLRCPNPISEMTRRGTWLASALGPTLPNKTHSLWIIGISIFLSQEVE